MPATATKKAKPAVKKAKPVTKKPASKKPKRLESAKLTEGYRLQLDPAILAPAPELSIIPMLGAVATHHAASRKPDHREAAEELQQDLAALHASLDRDGIIEPLKVTLAEDGQSGIIWDGRHRNEWALNKGVQVPVTLVTREQGLAIISATVAGRRHWTKGQKAWLAVQLNPSLLSNRTGPKKQGVAGREEIAHTFGVRPSILDQAIALAKAFEAAPALRERHEPGIWAGFGLGAVLAGIPGAQATAQKPRNASTWLNLSKPYGTLTTLGKAYATWSADDQEAAQETTAKWLREDCPPEFRSMLAAALTASQTQA